MSRRLHYLSALGIDCYVRHEPAPDRVADEPAEVGLLPIAPPTAARVADKVVDLGSPRAAAPAAVPLAAPDEPDLATLDLAALRRRVAACERCELHRSRGQTVFGVGNPRPKWLIIGEAPGQEEDRIGEPFVGKAGQLLDQMLLAAGQPREQVFIANVLKCRPPNNRDPRPEEARACAGYLNRQIELLQPSLIVAVGRIAAQRLLDNNSPLGKLRQQEHQYAGVPMIATYHPAYLLRSPKQKRKAFEDLLFAQSLLRRQAETLL